MSNISTDCLQLKTTVKIFFQFDFTVVPSAIAPTTPPFPYQQQLHSPSAPGSLIPTTAALPTIHQQTRQQTTHTYIQQPLYYFPSPPVSPTTSQLYHHPHANNAIIRLRGLHVGATPQEVAQFFQGYGVSDGRMVHWCNK